MSTAPVAGSVTMVYSRSPSMSWPMSNKSLNRVTGNVGGVTNENCATMYAKVPNIANRPCARARHRQEATETGLCNGIKRIRRIRWLDRHRNGSVFLWCADAGRGRKRHTREQKMRVDRRGKTGFVSSSVVTLSAGASCWYSKPVMPLKPGCLRVKRLRIAICSARIVHDGQDAGHQLFRSVTDRPVISPDPFKHVVAVDRHLRSGSRGHAQHAGKSNQFP